MTSEWVVAGAEIFLACGTVFLAFQARNEARSVREESTAVGEQVKLERERIEASLRPYVVPAPDSLWLGAEGPYANGLWRSRLPVKNAGPGVALNVQGGLNFGPPSGVGVNIMRTSLAPGDREDLRVQWADAPRPREDWKSVVGWLDYEDIHGGRWRTDFRIYEENAAYHVHVREVRHMMLPDGTPVG